MFNAVTGEIQFNAIELCFPSMETEVHRVYADDYRMTRYKASFNVMRKVMILKRQKNRTII